MVNSFISKFSEKEKKIFYVMMVFVLLAAFDRLLLGPALGSIKTIQDKINQQKINIIKDAKVLTHKDKIVNEVDKFKKYFSEAVQDDDVVNAEFLQTIEKYATQASINLIKSNPSEVKKQENYTEYFASLDCSGELSKMIEFMHTINSSDGLLKIVQVSMTPKKGSTTNEVNSSMTIVKLIMTPDAL